MSHATFPAMPASLNGPPISKLRKSERQKAVLALKVAGLKNGEIAKQLAVDRKTIQRDLEDSVQATHAVESPLNILNDAISAILKTEERAQRYAELAINAKNEAVSLGALQRIDDLSGIVTEKERIRAKAAEPQEIQPLFVFAGTTSVQVSVSRPRTINAEVVDNKE